MVPARTEARKKRRRQNVCGHHFVDCCLNSPPAFARILDEPRMRIESRVLRESTGGKVEQPGRDHAPAPPYLGDIRDVQIEPFGLRQQLGPSILQDIEAFRISLHQAVLDAVVHHLDEVAGPAWPSMDIATLDARIAATVTTWRSRNIARPGRERDKNRIKTVDDVLLAANHHAVSAFEAPDPAARSDVNVMQAAPLERLSTADIVFPEGVAAIDDDIARCEQHAKLVDGAFRDLAGRQHQPDRARLAELAHELFEPASACGPFVGQYPDGLRLPVKYDRLVSMLHQPANDVAAHAPQSNDPDLHRVSSFERAFDSGAQYCL